jgi:hypothetical protein
MTDKIEVPASLFDRKTQRIQMMLARINQGIANPEQSEKDKEYARQIINHFIEMDRQISYDVVNEEYSLPLELWRKLIGDNYD